MKNDLKISTLSIVCVLCAAVTMPSFGAAAVRSLGGAGTYSSASSAASAGSKSTGGTASVTRAGAMRVGNAKPASTSASTRAAASPRLSIGKYLAGVGATGTPSTTKPSTPGQADKDSSWKPRVEALEAFMGYTEDGTPIADKVEGLEVDVETLKADLKAVTGVDYKVTADYSNGVLIIKQGDVEVLRESFATDAGVQALQDKLDALTGRVAANETAIATLERAVESLEATVESLDAFSAGQFAGRIETLEKAGAQLQDAIDNLGALYATDDELADGLDALSAELKDLISKSASGGDVADLVEDLGNLSTDLTNISAQVVANKDAIAANAADIEELQQANFVKKAELDTLQVALLAAIEEKHAAGDYATAKDLEDLSKKVAELQENGGASSGDVLELQNKVNEITLNYATKDELDAVEADLLAKIAAIDLNSYVTNEYLQENYVTNEILAQKNYLTEEKAAETYLTETEAGQTFLTAENVNNFVEIEDGSITTAKLAGGAVTADKINSGTGNVGEMVMLMSNGDGTSQWVSVTVEE